MELCSHLAESLYLVILLKSVKTAGFWAQAAGTGIPSLVAATSRQLEVPLLGKEFGFFVF